MGLQSRRWCIFKFYRHCTHNSAHPIVKIVYSCLLCILLNKMIIPIWLCSKCIYIYSFRNLNSEIRMEWMTPTPKVQCVCVCVLFSLFCQLLNLIVSRLYRLSLDKLDDNKSPINLHKPHTRTHIHTYACTHSDEFMLVFYSHIPCNVLLFAHFGQKIYEKLSPKHLSILSDFVCKLIIVNVKYAPCSFSCSGAEHHAKMSKSPKKAHGTGKRSDVSF